MSYHLQQKIKHKLFKPSFIFLDMNRTTTSLLEILSYRAQYQLDHQVYIFLQNGETESGTLTYGELERQARTIAAKFQYCQGERALLLYPSRLEFITAFFGCLYAGVIAVPVYPPRQNQKLSCLLSIANEAQAKLALTTTSILTDIDSRWEQKPELLADLKWVAIDTIEANLGEFVPQSMTPDSLAFLQYTSGSTATPKGVMVIHSNIIHDQLQIQQAFGHSEKSIILGWLPLFRDIGLISNVLQPMSLGIPCILMPPVAFLMKPIRWLKAISKYRGTTSGRPNFAYDICVKKIKTEQLANLDLSSWDLAFNGSEALRAETLEQFSKKFAHFGCNYSAFYSCYRMAQTTLFTTGGYNNYSPVTQRVKTGKLEQNSVVKSEISSPESSLFLESRRPYSSFQYLVMVSFNKKPVGLILPRQNLDQMRQLSAKINLKVLSYLPNDRDRKNKRIAFRKWLKFRRTVFFTREEFREYEQIESEIVKKGYYLPFDVVKKGQRPSFLNRKKFWFSVLKLMFQPNVSVLDRYNDLLESLYGGKVNESYFVIKQLNEKSWFDLYKEGYGISSVNNGKFEPIDYQNTTKAIHFEAQDTYGYAFVKHMKELSKPLLYYFDGTGLRHYIRSVLGSVHDAHHPVLGFSTLLHEEIGILSFYTFYDHRLNIIPTYWAPGVVGVAGGLLKAYYDYFIFKLNQLRKSELAESQNLVALWITNAWLGMHLAENAKEGFYSYRWLSQQTFTKSMNSVRQELGVQVNQDIIDLKNSCHNMKTVPIFWGLLGVASRIMYAASIADNPELLEKLLSDLKEELTKAAYKLHGKEVKTALNKTGEMVDIAGKGILKEKTKLGASQW